MVLINQSYKIMRVGFNDVEFKIIGSFMQELYCINTKIGDLFSACLFDHMNGLNLRTYEECYKIMIKRMIDR